MYEELLFLEGWNFNDFETLPLINYRNIIGI